MVNLTIDKKAISVPEGTSILDAAAMNGLMIPTLRLLHKEWQLHFAEDCHRSRNKRDTISH